MSIKYVCRYCNSTLGELTDERVSEQQLGFHFLTPEERQDIISYNREGQITVKVVCDFCGEALSTNPELSLINNPLQ